MYKKVISGNFEGGNIMKDTYISENIRYIGADDKDLDLFEGQYAIPNGMAYNSYLILDDKIAVMDTIDIRRTDAWLANLEAELKGRTPDYLIVSHMEPDHAASIQILAEKYPDIKIVGNAKTFTFIRQFFDFDLTGRTVEVKEGDTLELGAHILQFIMAPMIHWPEVMMTYERSEKILFSADAFGKFGAQDAEEDWACEARRYYFNIVGKYGAQVQTLLKKAAALDIQTICSLHGPILKENLGYYIDKYNTWSSYEPEDKGVLIAYASIYGNTKKAAFQLAEMLKEAGKEKVAVTDLARDDMAEALEDAFRYDRMVLAASTYDGGIFPFMEEFLHHLKAKNYQKRTVGLIENGSWAPASGRLMRASLEAMKDITVAEPVVSIKSSLKENNLAQMEALVKAITVRN